MWLMRRQTYICDDLQRRFYSRGRQAESVELSGRDLRVARPRYACIHACIRSGGGQMFVIGQSIQPYAGDL